MQSQTIELPSGKAVDAGEVKHGSSSLASPIQVAFSFVWKNRSMQVRIRDFTRPRHSDQSDQAVQTLGAK